MGKVHQVILTTIITEMVSECEMFKHC